MLLLKLILRLLNFILFVKILEKEEGRWPSVEYTGGPLSITNMLKERFGMEQEEIEELYPEIIKNKDV